MISFPRSCDAVQLEFELTIRGPALNGAYFVGSEVNLANRTRSNHRSGSNVSASGPQSAVLRCMSKGKYIMPVLPGMYSGCSELEGYVESGGGRAQAVGLLSLTFRGTGGKSRSAS
jgi:hypothetical protein